jgi:hypothetical protein
MFWVALPNAERINGSRLKSLRETLHSCKLSATPLETDIGSPGLLGDAHAQ